MKLIHRIWNDLAQDDSGQDLIEYALIAGLIATAAITALSSLATKISGVLNGISFTAPAAGGAGSN